MEPTLITRHEAEKIKKIVAPLFGLPAWRAYSGFSTLFTIQFGELKISKRRISSEWSLFNSEVPWKIKYKKKTHVSSNDSRLRIHEGLRIIEGQTLLDIKFLYEDLITLFLFETISISLNNKLVGNADVDRHFSIFMPGNHYITIKAGNYWALKEHDR